MWARLMEFIIGIWLGMSWLIFRYSVDHASLQINDWICSVCIILFALISYKELFRYSHLLNFFIGLWLISWTFYSGTGIDFGPHQNYMVIGLLLLMFSLVPSRAQEPPKRWVEFLSKKKDKN
jgi:hypothetical protein